MDHDTITGAFDRAERALTQGAGLAGTGFWKAVDRLRRSPSLALQHARRAAEIDRRAFESAVKIRVPLAAGIAALTMGTAAGAVAIVVAASAPKGLATLLFLGGFGALLVCTHSLAHFLIGRLFGMRFTHVFVGGPPPPRPGVKVDYESYLLTSARRRGAMHASGAVVTKLVPFALVPVGLSIGVQTWGIVALFVVGVVQILTDIVYSTKSSDWKRALREFRASAGGLDGSA